MVGPDDPLPPPADALTQLTQGPEADSQPAPRLHVEQPQVCPGDAIFGGAGYGGPAEPRWLAFTRASDDDPRGSLVVLDLEDPGGGVMSLGVSASSEPDWSEDGVFLAYRSTAGDPDGDVLVGRFVRECPPDLGVSVLVLPLTVNRNAGLEVRVRVENVSSRPTSGLVVVNFSPLLDIPDGCGSLVCTLEIPDPRQAERSPGVRVGSESGPNYWARS